MDALQLSSSSIPDKKLATQKSAVNEPAIAGHDSAPRVDRPKNRADFSSRIKRLWQKSLTGAISNIRNPRISTKVSLRSSPVIDAATGRNVGTRFTSQDGRHSYTVHRDGEAFVVRDVLGMDVGERKDGSKISYSVSSVEIEKDVAGATTTSASGGRTTLSSNVKGIKDVVDPTATSASGGRNSVSSNVKDMSHADLLRLVQRYFSKTDKKFGNQEFLGGGQDFYECGTDNLVCA